jgi:competence ComEA-like helix-hairpin-helix protein
MKKNRISEPKVLNSAESTLPGNQSKSIPVFLVLGLCILAINVFSGLATVFQENVALESTYKTENFFWITGSPKVEEGLYRLSRKQLKQNFPEFLPFDSYKSTLQKTASTVSAIQYNSGLPRQISVPPAVANIFFLPISINSAGKEILSTLPGIGPVLAERILHRREDRGLFQSKKELLNINGIGPKKFARLVDSIIID